MFVVVGDHLVQALHQRSDGSVELESVDVGRVDRLIEAHPYVTLGTEVVDLVRLDLTEQTGEAAAV